MSGTEAETGTMGSGVGHRLGRSHGEGKVRSRRVGAVVEVVEVGAVVEVWAAHLSLVSAELSLFFLLSL